MVVPWYCSIRFLEFGDDDLGDCSDADDIEKFGHQMMRVTNGDFLALLFEGAEAVSYTHLDVYKRQVWIRFSSMRSNCLGLSAGISTVAVSYTHLDVYKRQALRSDGGRGSRLKADSVPG